MKSTLPLKSASANTSIVTPRGTLTLPTFLPDATRGVVKALDAKDLMQCGVGGLVMSTFHLMQNPGTSTIRALGGLHAMTGWSSPIITDSGGFQIYSLIHQNPKLGRIGREGMTFRPDGPGREYRLGPEKTIQLQLAYGADVLVCLDDCTHVDASTGDQETSVKRTIEWAARCKKEYLRLLDEKRVASERRPLLFAVVQGGGIESLRRTCAEKLLEIGFDGFGFGGWPLDAEGNLLTEILDFTRGLIPWNLPMHALGVGHPTNVVTSAKMGYDIFDSALPTRDARRGRLYTSELPLKESVRSACSEWFHMTYIQDRRLIKERSPIWSQCHCLTCQTYSLAYLHHLASIRDPLFPRLATIHNLTFMSDLMGELKGLRKGNQ